MTNRLSDAAMAEQRPILIRYVLGNLNEEGDQRPSSCLIAWDAAIKGPVPPRIESPIAVDLRRIKTPEEFRSLPIGAEVLNFRKGSWWGAIVVKVDPTSKDGTIGSG